MIRDKRFLFVLLMTGIFSIFLAEFNPAEAG